jgi:heat shock protein HslJ
MKPLLRLLLVVGLVLCCGLPLAVTACGDDGGQALEGTKWVLSAYAVDGTMKDALVTATTDATFADGQVSGNAGINQYNGPYEVDGDRLSVGPLASTKMAGDEMIMEQEAAFLMALEAAASYEIDGDTLIIMDSSGAAVLEFSPAEA